MTKIEWDKCFIWLAAMFPQWNVTAGTSAAWYDEIGNITTPDAFRVVIQKIMAKNPSPFPPGVFEIKTELIPRLETLPAETIWEDIFHGRCNPEKYPIAKKVIERMGGYERLSNIDFDELKFLKRTFMETYDNFLEKENDYRFLQIQNNYSNLKLLNNN